MLLLTRHPTCLDNIVGTCHLLLNRLLLLLLLLHLLLRLRIIALHLWTCTEAFITSVSHVYLLLGGLFFHFVIIMVVLSWRLLIPYISSWLLLHHVLLLQLLLLLLSQLLLLCHLGCACAAHYVNFTMSTLTHLRHVEVTVSL